MALPTTLSMTLPTTLLITLPTAKLMASSLMTDENNKVSSTLASSIVTDEANILLYTSFCCLIRIFY